MFGFAGGGDGSAIPVPSVASPQSEHYGGLQIRLFWVNTDSSLPVQVLSSGAHWETIAPGSTQYDTGQTTGVWSVRYLRNGVAGAALSIPNPDP